MTPAAAIRSCLVEKYATFSGRAPRPEYWWFLTAVLIAALIAGQLDARLFPPLAVPPLTTLLYLGTLLPLMAVSFRRMHDVGNPGWYIFLPMIVTISFVFLSTIGFASGPNPNFTGVVGTNRFLILGALQAVASLIILWWLTRPSEPTANAFGPPPAPQT